MENNIRLEEKHNGELYSCYSSPIMMKQRQYDKRVKYHAS
jgi:hypothetical protein